ncbi:helix-turn-helix domain-containing protein [Flavobacterium urocaniciphilum]|uniref:Helix-turn-helix n=1 Tax=Flavobacterium urocaniciphilum TaxID=1299341 RepID=A0A1H8YRS9_9FLAO|nr:helix-turn-helix domain-containing protein [Flavobacterium urocaniciphilum]SEP54829.1 Helix-turn-helix [Flavobacterium urocaniciphilum]
MKTCKYFGISQLDLAKLLKVTKSQIGMFEIGKRSLPVDAMNTLAEILKYFKDHSTSSKRIITNLKTQEIQKKIELEKALKENKYKQLLLERKMKQVEKKQQYNMATMCFVDYLEQKNIEIDLAKQLEKKATLELSKNGMSKLTQYEIEIIGLQAMEKAILEFLNEK